MTARCVPSSHLPSLRSYVTPFPSKHFRKSRREKSSLPPSTPVHPSSLHPPAPFSRKSSAMAPPTAASKSRQKSNRDRTTRRLPGPAPATAQTQVQTQAAPAVSQNVTIETSVQLVQTITQACVGSLAKLRHMFNEDNYESRRINVSDAATSGTAKGSDEVEKPPVLLQFSTLKRGVTSRADLLLDWVVSCLPMR